MAEESGFNINEFRGFISNSGTLRNNEFKIRIPFPTCLRGNPNIQSIQFANRNIELACDTTNFPLTGLHTYLVQRYSDGSPEPRPTAPQFGPLQCTFLCDSNADMQRFFQEWIKSIVNNDFSQGIFAPSGNFGPIKTSVYEVGYKQGYAVDMELMIFNQGGDVVRHVQFRDAFPAAVAETPFSWGRQNDLLKIPVVFAYTDWYSII